MTPVTAFAFVCLAFPPAFAALCLLASHVVHVVESLPRWPDVIVANGVTLERRNVRPFYTYRVGGGSM